MAKLREECLRKQVGMNLAVEKYQKAADEVLAERKIAVGNNQSAVAIPPTILPPVQIVARKKIGSNKRRDIDFSEFYSREKIAVPSESTSVLARENGASPPPDISSSGQSFDLVDEDPEYRRPARENERPSESSTSTQ